MGKEGRREPNRAIARAPRAGVNRNVRSLCDGIYRGDGKQKTAAVM